MFQPQIQVIFHPVCWYSSDRAKNRLLWTKNNRLGVEKHTLMRFPMIYSWWPERPSICILSAPTATGWQANLVQLPNFYTRLIIPLVFVIFHMLITAIVTHCVCGCVYFACKFASANEKYTDENVYILIAQKWSSITSSQ